VDSPQANNAPQPEPQVEPDVEPAVVEPATSAESDFGPEPEPSAETAPGSDIGETFAGLLQSAVEFVRAILDWVEERTRTIVKDRIAKPLAVATVVAAIGATAMATFVALAICLLIGGIVILLAKPLGWGLSALVVGFLITGGVALVLWRMWVAVMPDEEEE